MPSPKAIRPRGDEILLEVYRETVARHVDRGHPIGVHRLRWHEEAFAEDVKGRSLWVNRTK